MGGEFTSVCSFCSFETDVFISQVGTPEMGLENVEWVVVDEADVLLGR